MLPQNLAFPPHLWASPPCLNPEAPGSPVPRPHCWEEQDFPGSFLVLGVQHRAHPILWALSQCLITSQFGDATSSWGLVSLPR